MKKRLLSMVLTGAMLLSSVPVALAAPVTGFADMPEDWSRPALERAVENGLLQGADGKIDAYGTLTRSQMAAIMVRAFGATAKADLSGYSDVPADVWYYDAMATAVAMGVFQGSDGRLNPDAPITRQEAFTVLARAFVLTGADDAALADFEDNSQVASWAREAVAALVSGGYVKGSGGKVMPAATMTRAEFAQMVSNLVAAFDTPEGEVEGNVVLRKGENLPAGTVIEGDLIVAEGVDLADLDLSGVTVAGRVVIRGGASVTLGKDTQVGGGVVVANTQAPVSVNNNSGTNVDVTVAGAEEVNLNGGFGKVEVAADGAGVTLGDAKAEQVLVSGAEADITVSKDAQVKEVAVAPGADNAQLDVEKGGKVTTVETAASGTEIAGSGTVSKVEAQAGSEGTKVTTPNTSITVDKEAGAVETDKGTVEPGKTGSSSQTRPSDNSSGSTPTPPATTDIIYNGKVTAPILMDAAYANSAADQHAQRTYTQIKRAVGDLRQDIAMVTGAIDFEEIQQIFVDDDAAQAARLATADQKKVPALITDTTGLDLDYAIIVGAIDDSLMIQSIIDAGKLSEAATIKGKWESYVIKEVADPIPGVKNALVVAGADARGTIYGIYTISEEIGVSPWYWYSDVPVKTQSKIDVDYTTALVDDGPDVKYRGIFINDEDDSILKWAKYKFPTENGTPDVNYYRRVFELVLRLKGNSLWPAMHEKSTVFNLAVDEAGIPINSKEAAKYGVVMGSSHCEIMLRANTGEWAPWIRAYNTKTGNTNSNYDFTTNETAILQYWRERLETNKDFESVLTLGIRGVHDGAFQASELDRFEGNTKAEKQVSFMKYVVQKQRELIKEVYGVDNEALKQIPQVLIPYKEMGDVYNNGLKDMMAQSEYSDISLMWAEDNYGYIRQTPNDTEKARKGGAGVYYHASYYGSPTCYLWLNSTQLSLMSEQMHRAYDEEMRNQWILNVGDIKPGDQSMEFFLKMAWDVDAYNDAAIRSKFLKDQAMRDYGLSEVDAETVAAAMNEYYQMAGTKKPEFYTVATHEFDMSATSNGDEALLWAERSRKVVDILTPIYEALDPATQSAFYQQLYYHVLSANDAAEEYAYYWKAMQAKEQGRTGSTQVYVSLSKQARERIKDRVNDFNGQNDGKWSGYIAWTHLGGNQDRSHDIIQDGEYPLVPDVGVGVGAAAEGQARAGNATLRLNTLVTNDQRYFDVFNRSDRAVEWVAETDQDWIVLSQTSGTTSTEQRVIVTTAAITESKTGTIKVYNAENGAKTGEPVAVFTVEATVPTAAFGDKKGFIEANGYVAVEAEHYSNINSGADGSFWAPIRSNAQHGDTMKAYPDKTRSTVDAGAKLAYDIYFETAGTYNGTLYRLPTLSEGSEADGSARSCTVAVGVQGGDSATLTGNRTYINDGSYNTPKNAWSKNVMRMYEPLGFSITVNQGWNQIEITRLDPSMVIDRFVIETVGGALGKSLLGPVESPNNIAQGEAVQTVQIASLPAELADAVLVPNMTVAVGDGPTKYTGATELRSATSGEERVATVELRDGMLFVTPHRVGTSIINITRKDGEAVSFLVTVMPGIRSGGAYQEQDGLVVIDAGDAMENSSAAYAADIPTHQWKLSGIGMQVTPDNNVNWKTTSNLAGTAPAVSYQVKIKTAGDYYIYVNMSNPDAAADSYHLAVDGTYKYTDDKSILTDVELWRTMKTAVNLTAGEHTITIYAREDGFRLNQVLLSTKNDLSLNGLQTPSQRVEAVPRLTLGDLQDLSLTAGEGVEDITLTASASEGDAVTLTADSSNAAVAAAEVVGTTLKVTPVAAGGAEITVTAQAEGYESVFKKFTVTVTNVFSESDLRYQPDASGTIVIDAADVLQNKTYAKSSAPNVSYPTRTFAWVAVEERGIQLTPVANKNDKLIWDADSDSKANSTLKEKAPELTFTIDVPEAGEYYVSFYTAMPNVDADSFHLGINGVWKFRPGKDNGVISNPGPSDALASNAWSYGKKAVSLKAGENTITIWARESGVMIRQIMLSKATPSNLSGWQEATEPSQPTVPAPVNMFQELQTGTSASELPTREPRPAPPPMGISRAPRNPSTAPSLTVHPLKRNPLPLMSPNLKQRPSRTRCP